jgi:hypothetical protein
MSKDLGTRIYSGAASLGRIRAIIGVTFATLIGIGILVGGVFALAHKTKLTGKTIGIPVSVDDKEIPVKQCTVFTDKDNVTYRCEFKLKYIVENKPYYINTSTSSQINYSDMKQIDVYYDKSNPSNASLTKDDYHNTGYILIGSGIFLLLISWISLWVVLHYEFAAAASGATGVIDTFLR